MSDFLDSNDIMQKGYGIMPKLVMKDRNLSIEAKAIYAYIVSYAGAGKTAFPGVDLICHDLNISRNRFYKHRDQLIEYGYILVTKKRNDVGFDNNVYSLVSNPVCIHFVDTQNVDTQNVDTQIVDTQNEYANSNNSTSNSIKSIIDNKPANKSPSQKFNALEYLLSLDVPSDLAEDFIKHRKATKSMITKRVIDNIASQAAKANYTLEQAIDTLITKGWKSFNADWVNKPQAGAQGTGGFNYVNKQVALEQSNMAALEEFRRLRAEGKL